jgi:hypothetical protein
VLVGLNYIVVGEVFFPDQLAGVESVLGAVSSAVLSYYNAGVNPVFLAVVAYLSVCFALGSAPSTQDIKGFFFSMPKHIVSAIFFIGLIFTVVHLGEVEFVFFGYSLSSILGGFFNLAVFVQVVSISVFIASAPILVVADKFIELGFFERVFVFSAAVATYLVSQLFFGAEGASSMLYAVVVFLALLIFLRWQGLFINRKQASLRS